jgi:hypothetical protein
VVMAFEKNQISFNTQWQPAGVIKMGEPMGSRANRS